MCTIYISNIYIYILGWLDLIALQKKELNNKEESSMDNSK